MDTHTHTQNINFENVQINTSGFANLHDINLFEEAKNSDFQRTYNTDIPVLRHIK
jgi:hypothetical protein